MARVRIGGTLAATVTPLRDDGERLDEGAFAPLLEFYAASGVNGLFVLGTTGEGVLLTDDERRRAAELVISDARPLPVVVHCGAQSTARTLQLAAHAAAAGADAVAVMGPPYFALDEHEQLEHFAAAANACAPLPFYVYEYADRSGYAIPVEVVRELRERASNLAGLKVSDAPFERVEPYLRLGLDVFIGAEALIPQGLEHGAVGAVSGVAGAFPEAIAALVKEPTDERLALAQALRAALSRQSFQASVKAALGFRGLPLRADVRAPLLPLSAGSAEALQAELEALVGRGSASSEPGRARPRSW